MKKSQAIIVVALIIIGAVVVGAFISKLVWSWVVPDVFAGAVAQNILPGSITLWQAFKLSILTACFIGISRGSSNNK